MRKELLFAFVAFFFMSLHAIAGSFAQEQQKINHKVIISYQEDITGDGNKDDIILKGIPYSDNANYLKEIWADIITYTGKKYRIDYEPGYDPKISFVDLNHDGVGDLFQTSGTGGSGGIQNYRLDTLANDKLIELSLPKALNIQAHFEDHYKAKITFLDTNKTYTVNLKDRKEDYQRLGLYSNGRLNEPTELMVDPYAVIETVNIKGKQGLGLKAYQRISGAYHADSIGDAISYWYYENGKWSLVKINWVEIDDQ